MNILGLLTVCTVVWSGCVMISVCEKVMFIPLSHTSHARSHISVAKEMAALGHDVSVAVSRSIAGRVRKESTTVNLLVYGDENFVDVEEGVVKKSGVIDNFWAGTDNDVSLVWKISHLIWQNSIDTLEDPTFIEGIKNIDPDLIILDWSAFCKNMVIVPYKLKKPFAFLGSYVDPVHARIPFTPACNPMSMSDLDDTDMSFSQRFLNFLTLSIYSLFNPFCDDNIVSKYVPERPKTTVSELAMKAEIFVIETDYILDYVRPLLPNTKLIGGPSARPSQPLREPFKSLAERATEGLVVVTFGSAVLNIPENVSNMMSSSFKQTDLQIIWRANVTANVDNIHTSLWIPQNDLLGHPNTRMFLSHCGANGLYEALYHGVPVLCAPIFAEQFHNARRVVNKGYGLRVDIRDVTSHELARLISEVANNETYRKNIKTASKLFKQLFKDPVKEGAFWFDHVIRHGGNYMRFAGQEMPLYKFILLDVVAALTALFVFMIIFCYFTCNFAGKCVKGVWRRVSKKKQKQY